MQFPHFFAKHAAAVAAATAQTDLKLPLNNTSNNNSFDLFMGPSPPPPPASTTNKKSSKEDDFVNCNLCSKSFCNFDFLKLHLINKHGINDQPQQQQQQQQLKNEPNEIRYELKLHDSNANTETFCFICEKDFSNKNLLKIHIMQKHNLCNSETKATITQKIKSLIENNNNNNNNIDDDTKPVETEQLKMLNDDGTNQITGKCLDKVICNICNKQLCNKYFLRTHKAKVHGIKYELINGLSILSETSTSGYQATNSTSDDIIDGLDMQRKRKHDENDENNDDEKNMDIEQQQDSRADEDEKENVESGLKNNKKIDDSNNNNNNKQVSPLPTSYLKAYCTLCNKELCNKYFLKSHMLNAHNINIDTESENGPVPVTDDIETGNRLKINLKKQKINETAKIETLIETKYCTKSDNILLDSSQKVFNELYRSTTVTNPLQKQQQSAEFNMQPFLIESKEKRFNDNFVPCLVYLPVKNKIQTTIQLQLQLKPLDQNHLAAAIANDNDELKNERRKLSVSSSNISINDNLVINERRMSNHGVLSPLLIEESKRNENYLALTS